MSSVSLADFKVAISILASLGGAAGLGSTFAIRSASSSGRLVAALCPRRTKIRGGQDYVIEVVHDKSTLARPYE